MKKISAMLLLLLPLLAFADPQKGAVTAQKNSKCSVVKSDGEYPQYKVMRGKKALFLPQSDGIVAALISPSGKYVALSAGEADLIDVQPGKMEYGLAVVNCATGKVAGYRKGEATLITKWKGDLELRSDSGAIKFHEPGSGELP
jgi:hypothetical protein